MASEVTEPVTLTEGSFPSSSVDKEPDSKPPKQTEEEEEEETNSVTESVNINEIIPVLNDLLEPEVPDTDEIIRTLHSLTDALLEGSSPVRKRELIDAYHCVCRAWKACCSSCIENVLSPADGVLECRDAVVEALYALTAIYPKVIDDNGWAIITNAIEKPAPETCHIPLLKLIRNITIKSEENREHFIWNLELMEPLTQIVTKSKSSSLLVREWCATMKTLLLSDDPLRVNERKRIVARTRILTILAGYLSVPEYEEDEDTLNALVVLMGTMAVYENFCVHIEQGNGLVAIYAILKNHFQNKTLTRNTISLLRYLCVDEIVRVKCKAYPLVQRVIEILKYYKKDLDIIDVGVSCTAFLTVKVACHVSRFVGNGGLPLLLQIMTDFKTDTTILKAACLTLRNICENCTPAVKETIKKLGFVEFLGQLNTDLPELTEFYITPVLRELNLDAPAQENGVNEKGEEEEEEGDDDCYYDMIGEMLGF